MVGTVVDTRRKVLDNRLKRARETCCLTLENLNLKELSDDMILPNVTSLRLARNRLDINAFEHFKIYKLIRLDCKQCGLAEILFECHLGKIATLEFLDLSDNALKN